MGKFEELDTDEPLAARIDRHRYDRLIMLSDGVFAIAVTLAALEIRPPSHWDDLPGLWAALQFPLFAYLISFAVIAVYWSTQRDLISRLSHVDRIFTLLALAQLMFVALVPAATQLLYQHGPDGPSVQLYALVLAICGLLSAGLWAYGAFKPGMMSPEVGTAYRWVRLAAAAVVPLCFIWVGLFGSRNIWMAFIGIAILFAIRRLVLPRFAEPAVR